MLNNFKTKKLIMFWPIGKTVLILRQVYLASQTQKALKAGVENRISSQSSPCKLCLTFANISIPKFNSPRPG